MKNFNVQVYPTFEKMSQVTADLVWQDMSQHLSGKYILGLATGNTPILTYKNLLKIISSQKPDLSNLHLFNLDEYWPIKKNNPNSYYQEMLTSFWQPLIDMNLGFTLDHAYIPDSETQDPHQAAKNYESLLQKIGYPDLQIVGIGMDGHLAFNEKGTAKDSTTHLAKLADSTIKANQSFFDNKTDQMPQHGICMGISSILKAKKIILIANGQHKKPIIRKLLNSSPGPDMASSFLRLHSDTTIILDQDCYAK